MPRHHALDTQQATQSSRERDAAAQQLARDSLDLYLDELGAYTVLSAEQEIALGREIEAREIDHWRELLSYAPALSIVAGAAQAHFTLPRKLRAHVRGAGARRSRAAAPGALTRPEQAALARALREADATRIGLYAADQAVESQLRGQSRADAYLRRVRAARRAQTAVKQRFVAANLRLVVAMARKTSRKLMPLADLIQEGNLGLLRAVERYDYRRGFRFSTYAAWWIRHGLNRALSDKARLVRIPVHAIEDGQRVREAEQKLRTQDGALPTAQQIADETGFTLEKVRFLRDHVQQRAPLSLDQQVGDENQTSFIDLVTEAEVTTAEELLEQAGRLEGVRAALSDLTEIESAVLHFRFGLDGGEELTLREIGDRYNLSRERIRQLQEQALGKLRAALSEREAAPRSRTAA